MRLRKGGPLTPCRIEYAVTPDPWFPDNPMDRSGEWRAFIGDRQCAHVDEVWLRRGTAISRTEYERHMDRRRDLAARAPEHPLVEPERPVDWLRDRLPF